MLSRDAVQLSRSVFPQAPGGDGALFFVSCFLLSVDCVLNGKIMAS